MFYSYDVLNIRNGKFAFIWLAANGRLQVKHKNSKDYRNIMKITVEKSCEDIMNFLPTQEDYSGRRSVSKRFSLYLCAMLMSGTTRVFQCQVNFLFHSLEEALKSMTIKYSFEVEDLKNISFISKEKSSYLQLQEPSAFFGATNFTLDLIPSADWDAQGNPVVTPRKTDSDGKRKSKKRTPRKDEPQEIRSEGVVEPAEGITMHNLLQDWTDELTFPNVTDSRAITMIDEWEFGPPTTVAPPIEHDKIITEDIDFGGPLGYIPEGFLQPVAQENILQVEQLAPEQASVAADESKEAEVVETTKEPEAPVEVPTEGQTSEVPVQDQFTTPFQAQEPVEPRPVQKRKKTDTEDVNEITETAVTTVDPRPRRPPLQLNEVEPLVPRPKRKKRGRLIIDTETKISRQEVKRQQTEGVLKTYREQTAEGDIIRKRFWHVMKNPDQLLNTCQRVVSEDLRRLMISRYVADPDREFFSFEERPARQLEFQSGEPVTRDRQTPLGIQKLQVSHLESSDGSIRSIRNASSVSFETPAPVPSTDKLVLQPISGYEKEPVEMPPPVAEPMATPSIGPPKSIRPTRLFESEEREMGPPAPPPVVGAEDILQAGIRRREAKRQNSPDEGPTVVTVTADVHHPPSSMIVEQAELEPLPVLLEPVVQGEEGLSMVQPIPLEAEELPSKGPHHPVARLIPTDISAISRTREDGVETTITESLGEIIGLVRCVPKGHSTTFADLIGDAQDRRGVADAFAYCLDMHKKKILKLEQDVFYGTIYVCKLRSY